ncbi:hypothetical protein [Flagellimonas abyssi]|nr:hypothetical protein [Allomuricauda abyssi]
MLTNDLMRLYNVSSYLADHLNYFSVAIYPTSSKKTTGLTPDQF